MLIYEWECAWLVNITCKQSFWPDKLIAILAGHNVSWLAVFFSPNVYDKLEVCQQLPGCKKKKTILQLPIRASWS